MITKFELSTRHKAWAKIISSVDKSKSNGYAFGGKFVKVNQLVEVPDDSFVLCYQELGSNKNKEPEITLYQCKNEKLITVIDGISGWDWALKIRDDVAELIEGKKEKDVSNSDLSKFSNEELIEELKNRGISIKI